MGLRVITFTDAIEVREGKEWLKALVIGIVFISFLPAFFFVLSLDQEVHQAFEGIAAVMMILIPIVFFVLGLGLLRGSARLYRFPLFLRLDARADHYSGRLSAGGDDYYVEGPLLELEGIDVVAGETAAIDALDWFATYSLEKNIRSRFMPRQAVKLRDWARERERKASQERDVQRAEGKPETEITSDPDARPVAYLRLRKSDGRSLLFMTTGEREERIRELAAACTSFLAEAQNRAKR